MARNYNGLREPNPHRAFGNGPRPRWGVVKSLALIGAGPVGLIRTQKVGIKYKKPLKEKGSVWDQALVRCDAALIISVFFSL